MVQHHRSDDILVFGIILLVVDFVIPFLGLPGFGWEIEGFLILLALVIIAFGLLGRRTGRAIYGE